LAGALFWINEREAAEFVLGGRCLVAFPAGTDGYSVSARCQRPNDSCNELASATSATSTSLRVASPIVWVIGPVRCAAAPAAAPLNQCELHTN
jgi:hypothetical protein